MLDCYIINLDRAKERWDSVSAKFSPLGFHVVRVPAIEGKTLELSRENVSLWQYFFLYGRPVSPGAVGCYLSHIKTLQLFLDSKKEFALICEDDAAPVSELPEIITEAMKYADHWDLLRLNGLKQPPCVTLASLCDGYDLCSDLKYTSCTAGMVVNRLAAQAIIKKLLPMRMPYDVALFYDFPVGIREVSVNPYPIQFKDAFESCIGATKRYPVLHPAAFRYMTVLPYRVGSRLYRLWYRKWFAKKLQAEISSLTQ